MKAIGLARLGRDAELRRLQNALEMAVNDAQRSWSELAAAEARNATLTDDAARAERNRDMWREQCARQAEQLESLAKEKAHDRQRTS